MAPTNEAVERLNERCQRARIRSGEIDADGPAVAAGAHQVFVGDEIATRHNDRRLVTDRGDMVRNRATWTVTGVHVDGSLTVAGRCGTVHLPAAYVAEHVELAYATHRHRRPGPHRRRRAAVPRRRDRRPQPLRADDPGTETNEAFIVTTGEQSGVDVSPAASPPTGSTSPPTPGATS